MFPLSGVRSLGFLGFLLGASSCAIQPPNYSGEVRGREESVVRPEWTQAGVQARGGVIRVTGVATRRSPQDAALRAAEDDARQRLAASFRTRIVSATRDRTDLDATIDANGNVSGGQTIDSTHEIRSYVDEVIRGAKSRERHVERYEVFEDGWAEYWDAWVLLEMPEALYDAQLRGALAELGSSPD